MNKFIFDECGNFVGMCKSYLMGMEIFMGIGMDMENLLWWYGFLCWTWDFFWCYTWDFFVGFFFFGLILELIFWDMVFC